MNFNLHFGELHSDNYINDKNNFFENYIPKCYKVKRIIISFNCFSEYISYRSVFAACIYIAPCLSPKQLDAGFIVKTLLLNKATCPDSSK